MRYYYDKPDLYSTMFGMTHHCDHPVYDICTLYTIGDKGLSVIQQRFDILSKRTWWEEIDPWLVDSIYLNKNFKSYFEKFAGVKNQKNIYPTVSVRQIMWALKMKPLKREPWETAFDHTPI